MILELIQRVHKMDFFAIIVSFEINHFTSFRCPFHQLDPPHLNCKTTFYLKNKEFSSSIFLPACRYPVIGSANYNTEKGRMRYESSTIFY
jgi:hypothetical protein